MIVKGAARAGPTQLGNYLMRLYASADKNEYTELLELQSPWATPETPARERAAAQLVRTFRDWQILAEGTKQGRDGLYHAQINPAATYAMTPEQWIRAADILGEELGLKDQQRAIVLHGGEDRPHIHVHVVWARTDIDTMKLHSDSYNYVAHEEASKRMELEFGHEFVPGKHAKRDRDKQPEFPRAEMTQDECQQAERTGADPARRKDQITALKQASDSASAFKAGLEEQGYILAKGDKRGFVLIDEAGEIYSLSRQIRGVKPAELREFMKGIDPQTLPTVEQATQLQQQTQDAKKQAAEKQTEPVPSEPAQPAEQPKSLSPDEIQAIQKAVADRQAREARDIRQRQENEYNRTREILDQEIAEKVAHLDAMQQAERARFARENAPAKPGLDRVIDTFQRWWKPKLAQERDAEREHRQQEMKSRQTKACADHAALLKQTRDTDLENLAERHAQQLRDYAHRTEEDLNRYIREQETARRLLAERQERERQQEQKRTKDGPEWPPPLTR